MQFKVPEGQIQFTSQGTHLVSTENTLQVLQTTHQANLIKQSGSGSLATPLARAPPHERQLVRSADKDPMHPSLQVIKDM